MDKNGITEIVFIIDKSGSMCGLESDTIGGFNSMIAKQKKEDGECFVSTVLFNNESELIHDRIEISKVKPLTEKEYSVDGCTALVDAVGDAIKHISDVHRYIRQEDVPEHTMFVITTDGLENASHRYTSDELKTMIEKKKKESGWEFIFIGANIDAVETAGRYGIDKDRAVNYVHDSVGTGGLYECACGAVSQLRAGKCIDKTWSDAVKKDFRKRNRNK